MADHIFTIQSPNDEVVEYYLDGEHLITANHDEHGWSGMEGIEAMVATIAKNLGIPIEHVEYEGEDD